MSIKKYIRILFNIIAKLFQIFFVVFILYVLFQLTEFVLCGSRESNEMFFNEEHCCLIAKDRDKIKRLEITVSQYDSTHTYNDVFELECKNADDCESRIYLNEISHKYTISYKDQRLMLKDMSFNKQFKIYPNCNYIISNKSYAKSPYKIYLYTDSLGNLYQRP